MKARPIPNPLPLLGLACALSAEAADPAWISIRREGTAPLSLAWTVPGRLERAPQPGGPWTEVSGASSPHLVTPTGAPSFFRLRRTATLTVRRDGDGGGAVRSIPAGIDCPGTCAAVYNLGIGVTLTAVPEAGSVFTGWAGDCTGTGGCEVTLDGPRSVTATFAPTPGPPGGFLNGDFEQGPGVGWLQEPGNMIYTAEELGLSPYSGRYAAWVGFHPDNRRSAAIGQRVTLPATPPIYLNMALWLYSQELCDPPWWDTFGLYIDGEPLLENSHLCDGNTGGEGWRRLSFDLSALAGRTVLIGFEISSIDALASVALIDDVAIARAPW